MSKNKLGHGTLQLVSPQKGIELGLVEFIYYGFILFYN